MRGLIEHKTVVGLSAMLLAVAVGAVAWATPGDGLVAEPLGPPILTETEGEPAFFGRGHGRPGVPGEVPRELKERMEERRALREQRRDAFLGLVREKMSAEDQAALDRLTAQAERQREALRKALEALGDTERQIGDLVGEYLPSDPAPTVTPTEENAQ